MARPAPLSETLVVDASRMLPGAVLARCLVDLGARVIKIEDPRGGDLLRSVPPLVDGIGVGFCLYFRGTESVALDLRSPEGQATLRTLLRRADVFVESFRPGTLAKWGIDLAAAEAENPRLISCSLPGFAENAGTAVAHDLNLTGLTGISSMLPGGAQDEDPGSKIPRFQLADVNTGLLAAGSVLAALLRRERDGRGGRLTQPLLAAPLPLVAWAWADHQAGGGGMSETILSGRAACYRNYRCGDGLWMSVGCLEPKFWVTFVELLGRPELAPAGFDTTDDGKAVAGEVSRLLAAHPRAHWMALFEPHALPIAPVHALADAIDDPVLAQSSLLEQLPLPDGTTIAVPGPAMTSIGQTPAAPAPSLGEHTESVLRELGE